MPEPALWQTLAEEAQRHRDETIARLDPPLPPLPAELPLNVTGIPRQLLSKEEVQLTETPVDKLLTALAEGKIKSVDLTRAYLRRAGIAQLLTNCVLELIPETSLARAQELDNFLAQNKCTVGPLHGLPISIKARVPIKGLRRTEGFVGSLQDVAEDDASIIKVLHALGAIPYVRTTEPQGMMMLDNISPIHGITTNPHNTYLTPGGSSGGEGALLALLASPLGLGSDIGGSVRSPSANCGLYTLKPTVGRLPMFGLRSYSSGIETIVGTLGPMAPTKEGVSIFMKTILDTKPWKHDSTVLPIPWRDVKDEFGPTINVGVMWDDGVVTPSKSMTRALQEVVAKLESHPRFKVTRWEPFKAVEAMKMMEKLYSPDAGESFQRWLDRSGEPFHELTKYRLVTGPGVEKLDLESLFKWTKVRDVFRYEYLQEWANKAPEMHVILTPPHPSPAPPIGTPRHWLYTSLFNLLDYPATVFPVTKVDPKLDAEDPSYTPRSDIDAWCHKHFDAEKQAGAPVCLQLVGKKLHDELVVAAMNEICEAIKLPFIDCLR